MSTTSTALSRLRQQSEGAILVVGIVMGMLMVGALWNLVSIGDAILWREHLQDAADAAAFENGQLACIAQRGQRRGLASLVEGAREFLASGDLSRLGDLRYVAARKLPNGKTQVLAIWSEGAFRIASLFPERGDAPGSDPAQVARPPETTRSLCALAPGRSYGLRLYDSQRSLREVLAFYDRALPEAGWQPLPLLLADGKLRDGLFARAFTRDGHAIAIAVEARGALHEQDEVAGTPGGSSISLVDRGSVQRSAALSMGSPVE